MCEEPEREGAFEEVGAGDNSPLCLLFELTKSGERVVMEARDTRALRSIPIPLCFCPDRVVRDFVPILLPGTREGELELPRFGPVLEWRLGLISQLGFVSDLNDTEWYCFAYI